jgi:hypothetical protein
MSRYFQQIKHGQDARRMLDERLARKETGDEAYEKAASYTDQRRIKIMGVVLIAIFGIIVLAVTALGY